jgi:LysM repeat protein
MRRIIEALLFSAVALFAAHAARAQDLTVPQQITAGDEVDMKTSGSGSARLYLYGPANVIVREVELGKNVTVAPEEVRSAGRYTAVLAGDKTVARQFYVTAAQPKQVNFLARPSRVPAARSGAVTGAAFVFDEFNNIVRQATPVKFNLAVAGSAAQTRVAQTHNGIAWTRLDSGRKEGPAQFTASVGDFSVRRVVQHTASEPCDLRFTARRAEKGDRLIVETSPVRDCAGNAVPDGTIVTFIQVGPSGRSTVDARIKRGVARAELPAQPGLISVASGVVMGNELNWGGGI